MEIKVNEAADLIGGTIFGNPDAVFSNVAKIEDARQSDLTFLSNPAYKKFFADTKAAAIIVESGFEKSRDDITYIEAEKPNTAFQKIVEKYFNYTPLLENTRTNFSLHPSAKMGENCIIGDNVVISENCIIGDNVIIFHNCVILENVKIGNNSIIYPNVTIRENTVIGNNVILHPGVVLGADGFGYSQDENKVYTKIPQIGNVVLEDNVEIGANTTIDRAALGSTIIKKGSKIDNLVQIAHNVSVGENTVISAQTGISGSTKIGNRCIIAGQVGTVGHIEIKDDIIIGAQSGISKSLIKPGMYFGYPAKEISVSRRLESHIRNLPNYSEKIKELEEKIRNLENSLNSNNDRDNA